MNKSKIIINSNITRPLIWIMEIIFDFSPVSINGMKIRIKVYENVVTSPSSKLNLFSSCEENKYFYIEKKVFKLSSFT